MNKFLTIGLYVLTAFVWVFFFYGQSTQATIAPEDYESVAMAGENLKNMEREMRYVTLTKYNYIQRHVDKCADNPEGGELLRKAGLLRNYSIEAKQASQILAGFEPPASVMQETKLQPVLAGNVETAMKAYAEKLNTLGKNMAFIPPIPFEGISTGRAYGLEAFQDAPYAVWKLVDQVTSSIVYQMEDELVNQFVGQVYCENANQVVRVLTSPVSRVLGRNDSYVGDMYLTTPFFMPNPVVTTTEGVFDQDLPGGGTLTIRGNADIEEFDGLGRAAKFWRAEIKVPGLDGYETFNVKRDYFVNRK